MPRNGHTDSGSCGDFKWAEALEESVVHSIQELSELSRKLNQKSDQLNTLISSVNEKLSKLNLGVEAWLIDAPIITSDYDDWDYENDCRMEPEREASLLGYCEVEGAWQLAVRDVTLVEKQSQYDGHNYEEAKNSRRTTPFLKASRNIRVQAMRLIPALLDLLKASADRLVKGIEEAEKAAEKL